jgi:hypothetical protein
MSRALRSVGGALVALMLTGCGAADLDAEGPGHTHGANGVLVSNLVGDGTRGYEVGYRMTDVTVPARAGRPGKVSFQIHGYDGRPLRDYLIEQTKKLHLYLVRTDLAVYRHLHPTLADDGTWSVRVTVPKPGDYRVIAEFVARDAGGNGDHVMVGRTATVPGAWSPQRPVLAKQADDGVVSVEAEGALAAGTNGRMQLVVRDAEGRPVNLGSYLGTFAHVTGFHLASGSAVHMHPLGQPEVDDDGTRLEFHTEFTHAGDYLLFVEVRVDGFLHTLPLAVTVD